LTFFLPPIKFGVVRRTLIFLVYSFSRFLSPKKGPLATCQEYKPTTKFFENRFQATSCSWLNFELVSSRFVHGPRHFPFLTFPPWTRCHVFLIPSPPQVAVYRPRKPGGPPFLLNFPFWNRRLFFFFFCGICTTAGPFYFVFFGLSFVPTLNPSLSNKNHKILRQY